jgi:hypothetical protein
MNTKDEKQREQKQIDFAHDRFKFHPIHKVHVCMNWYMDLNKSFLFNVFLSFSLNTNHNERKKW